jgi:hypothetical protein
VCAEQISSRQENQGEMCTDRVVPRLSRAQTSWHKQAGAEQDDASGGAGAADGNGAATTATAHGQSERSS